MSTYQFADLHNGMASAYLVEDDGTLTPTRVMIDAQGRPCDGLGEPLADDGDVVTLRGWRHARAASFARGRVLVALAHEQFVVEGRAGGQWSRDAVEAGGSAVFAAEAEAQAAVDSLVRVCGWDRTDLRVRAL